MASYLVEIVRQCDGNGCTARATVEVRNRWNASMGQFCRRCGQRRVRQLNQAERQETTHATPTD